MRIAVLEVLRLRAGHLQLTAKGRELLLAHSSRLRLQLTQRGLLGRYMRQCREGQLVVFLPGATLGQVRRLLLAVDAARVALLHDPHLGLHVSNLFTKVTDDELALLTLAPQLLIRRRLGGSIVQHLDGVREIVLGHLEAGLYVRQAREAAAHLWRAQHVALVGHERRVAVSARSLLVLIVKVLLLYELA